MRAPAKHSLDEFRAERPCGNDVPCILFHRITEDMRDGTDVDGIAHLLVGLRIRLVLRM